MLLKNENLNYVEGHNMFSILGRNHNNLNLDVDILFESIKKMVYCGYDHVGVSRSQ